MGDAIGSITDAVGLTDHAGAEAARAQSAQAQAWSQGMTEEQLEFQREQYDDWKAVYGDLQENLGDYYKNLDPADYEARGLQNVQKEFQLAKERIDTSLAQRGLSTSGVQAATDVALEAQAASQRVGISQQAEDQVAQMKQGFLGLGLGQGTSMLGIQAGVANTGASTGMNRANTLSQVGLQQSLANQDVMGSIVGGAAGYAMGVPPSTLFG